MNTPQQTLYYYAQSQDRTDMRAQVAVYEQDTRDIAGHSFEFCIIGWSHMVRSLDPQVPYTEVLSCVACDDDAIALDAHTDAVYEASVTAGSLTLRQCVWAVSLVEGVVDTSAYDLVHTFENGSITGIAYGNGYYETVHEYPEWGRVVYSRTEYAHG